MAKNRDNHSNSNCGGKRTTIKNTDMENCSNCSNCSNCGNKR